MVFPCYTLLEDIIFVFRVLFTLQTKKAYMSLLVSTMTERAMFRYLHVASVRIYYRG